ncbi:hypothetical protein FRACYDRAFT_233528 [Fragilariopsis cylindrus CCMP1102]|uniref:DUF6824 domain-containing protein n=1 Tax=Fragilariopsis cylindrus CCMP1102 TaxID=635003 RepID=A0A1E7FYY5_9STRA|nr:hypothetical protein FRACYDRAFT_233528 [Fragilariopsis cylindrus CCMP1102]|eukprot:OEU23355.1 hypothetical protein FRACYDRAFT_233528 [Fragilariopsis cylindrus CCMP1102]
MNNPPNNNYNDYGDNDLSLTLPEIRTTPVSSNSDFDFDPVHTSLFDDENENGNGIGNIGQHINVQHGHGYGDIGVDGIGNNPPDCNVTVVKPEDVTDNDSIYRSGSGRSNSSASGCTTSSTGSNSSRDSSPTTIDASERINSHHSNPITSFATAVSNTIFGENNNKSNNNNNNDTPASTSTPSSISSTPTPPPTPPPPITSINTDSKNGVDVDELLSKELMELSFNDRNNINEEIHGVQCLAPSEDLEDGGDPLFVHNSLLKLQIELNTIPNTSELKIGYQKSQELLLKNKTSTTSFVNTTEFRLKFLRCELYDVKKAAIRLCNYLNLVQELFGDYALERSIKLSDFSKHEIQILRTGYYQLWPFRDRAGRRILSIVGNLGMEFDPTLRTGPDPIKAYFYFWMVASNDVETQQKGVVFLVYPTISKKDGGSGSSKGATISQMMLPNQIDRILHKKCNEAAPIRIAAVHFCLPNTPFFHLLRSVMTMTLPVSYRNRLKFHVGEGIELQYILKGFGIPTENLPITDTGNIKTTYLKQWLRVRKVIEVEMTPSGQSTKTLSIIECPRSVDVIFRPGTSMLCHPGNVTFRGLVESKQHRTTVKKTDKEQVALEIINDIQNLPNGGGRFLIWDNIGYWSDISNDIPICVEKIAISYRDYKSKIRHSVSHTNNNTTANIMLPTAVTSLSRRPSNNNNNNKNKNNNNSSNKDPAATTTTTTTTTQSMNCSTYAFLGQQLDSNKKRKRTTNKNNLLCGGDSGGVHHHPYK